MGGVLWLDHVVNNEMVSINVQHVPSIVCTY